MTEIDRRQFIVITTIGALFPTCSVSSASPSRQTFALLAEHLTEIEPGWLPIVTATIEKMVLIDPELEIRQIKQKFGGLRLYYRSKHRDQLTPIVREAELLCENTCESCGRPGNTASVNGWIRTLCKEHRDADS